MSSSNFWKNRKVLVTGYEGFLGSHLTRRLLDLKARVIGLDILTGRKKTILNRQDYRRLKVIRGNVANLSLLRQILKRNRIEIIFHLAAEALVGRCLQRPLRGFDSNIKGAWNVLESARLDPGVKAIVMASSDKAYGSHKKLPYTETTALKGDHPYDVSKSCADLLAYTYYHTYNVPVAVTRCGNIYGPGDFNFSRIVPDAIQCALRGKTLLIRSDGTFTRDYVYVDDIVEGYIALARQMQGKKLMGAAFNFSHGRPLSVVQIVQKIFQRTKRQPDYKILNQARDEIRHQYLSARKARHLLGWRPRWQLQRGLDQTIAWYRQYWNLGA